ASTPSPGSRGRGRCSRSTPTAPRPRTTDRSRDAPSGDEAALEQCPEVDDRLEVAVEDPQRPPGHGDVEEPGRLLLRPGAVELGEQQPAPVHGDRDDRVAVVASRRLAGPATPDVLGEHLDLPAQRPAG